MFENDQTYKDAVGIHSPPPKIDPANVWREFCCCNVEWHVAVVCLVLMEREGESTYPETIGPSWRYKIGGGGSRRGGQWQQQLKIELLLFLKVPPSCKSLSGLVQQNVLPTCRKFWMANKLNRAIRSLPHYRSVFTPLHRSQSSDGVEGITLLARGEGGDR